jgi:maleylpyruvate isomerase
VTASPRLRLLGYWRSSSSWRVRIGLELKGLSWEYVAVDLRAGAQFSPEHERLSAMSQVPVLEVQDEAGTHHLTQSMAILEWMDERFPSPPLLPADSVGRARVRALAEHVNSGIQPFHNAAPMRWLRERGRLDRPWVAEWVGRGLAGLERAVREGAGRFCHGDAVTLADLYLVPQLYSARRFDVDLSGCPTLLRVEQACRALEPFRRAEPEVQPDAPPPGARS